MEREREREGECAALVIISKWEDIITEHMYKYLLYFFYFVAFFYFIINSLSNSK